MANTDAVSYTHLDVYKRQGLVRQTGLGDTPRSLPPLAPTDAIIIGDAVLTQLDLVDVYKRQ